jgi:hypothetical protein
MKRIIILTMLVVFAVPLSADGPKGTVPRSSAEKYAAHAESGGAAIGAALLNSRDVHKAFSTDLTRCCLVVEVALYPAKGGTLDVSSDDFVLRLSGTETAVKTSSAALLAAELQKKNSNAVGIAPAGEIHVGYESGNDPLTGQRVHGVETGGSVGVGIGRQEPAPASTDRDRRVMEMELTEKALPEETASAPVAGYLYFSTPKDNRKAHQQLEYTLKGQKVTLNLD